MEEVLLEEDEGHIVILEKEPWIVSQLVHDVVIYMLANELNEFIIEESNEKVIILSSITAKDGRTKTVVEVS